MAILIQYANGVPGVKFVLDKSEITIGRGLDNDISIDDEFVSKQHAVIQLLEDDLSSRVHCVLIDNNSTNHTFVNNAPITAHRLDEQDKIFIGQNEFRFLSESVLSAELGSAQNRFFSDDAPGLMHAALSDENASQIASRNERSRSNLVTTRIDEELNPFIGIPLDGYTVDEISDAKHQPLNFANEPSGTASSSMTNEIEKIDAVEKSDDLTKKRFSRRLVLR